MYSPWNSAFAVEAAISCKIPIPRDEIACFAVPRFPMRIEDTARRLHRDYLLFFSPASVNLLVRASTTRKFSHSTDRTTSRCRRSYRTRLWLSRVAAEK